TDAAPYRANSTPQTPGTLEGIPIDGPGRSCSARPTSKERSMRTHSPTPQKSTTSALASSLQHAASDVYRGFIHTTQNSLALLGLFAAIVLLVFGMRADLRNSAEERLLG